MLDELKENIKRHYGNSDEDLADLAAVMDALKDVDQIEAIKAELETAKLEAEKALKDLDAEWRERYRSRFFDGDVSTPDIIDLENTDEDTPEEITIEEYLEEITKEK